MAVNWRSIFKIRQRILMAVLMCLILAFQHPCRYTVHRMVNLLMLKYRHDIHHTTRNISRDCETEDKLHPMHDDERAHVAYQWRPQDIPKMNVFFLPAFAIANTVGGYLADKYGGKYVLATSALGGSLVNLLIPTLIFSSDGSFYVILGTRVLEGLFEGLSLPACTSISAHWSPLKERARLYALAASGMMLGSAIHNIWTNDLILRTRNWPTAFYVWGSLLLGAGVMWCVFGASNPEESRFISEWEKMYLQKELRGLVHHQRKVVPIWRILKTLDVWTFTIAMIGHVLVWTISIRMLHKYPRDIIGIHLEYKYSQSIPAFIMFAMALCIAWFSDWTFNNDYININTLRVTFTNIGIIGCPIYLIATTFAGCEVGVVLTFLAIAMGLQGAVICGIQLVALDLSPNYAGFLTGLSTCFATLSGVLVVQVVFHHSVPRRIVEYQRLFVEMLLGSTVTTLIFVVFGRTHLKEWNTPPTKQKIRRE